MLERLGLSTDEEAVYHVLLDQPLANLDELAAALNMDRDRVAAAAHSLEAGGLAERRRPDPEGLVLASPLLAFESALLKGERQLREARAHVQSLHDRWSEARRTAEADGVVAPVHGGDACLLLWQEAHASAHGQVRALERPPYLRPQTEPNPVEVDLLARRVPHRVLYDSAVIALPGRFDELKTGIQNGEKARVHPAVPLRVLLIDEKMALLPMRTGRYVSDGLFVVRPCAVLDALSALFELLWEQAVPLRLDADYPRDERAGARLDRLVLKLMAAGLSDVKIARQLGLSERTLQRRLASLMNRLGAGTRFQAGVQAARKGWV